MATKKRRIIYLSDEEWADIQKWAKERGQTASALIRESVFDDSYYSAPPSPPKPDLTEDQWFALARKELPRLGQCIKHGHVTERCCDLFEPAVRKPFLGPAVKTQAQRDAILRRINKGG